MPEKKNNLIRKGMIYKIVRNGVTYLVGEDYFYKTESYYEIVENENSGGIVFPSSMAVLDAYIVPICLQKAKLAGIPVCDYKISSGYISIPSIIYGLNYYANPSNYFIVKENSNVREVVRHISHNGKYPFCYQKIKEPSETVIYPSIFGKTKSLVPELKYIAEKIYKTFKIPLLNILVVNIDGEYRLSSLMSVRYSKIHKSEKEHLKNTILNGDLMNSENGTSHVTNYETLNGPIYSQSKILESIKKDYSSILGIFVDRQEISNSQKLDSLIKFRDAAEEMRHDVYFIFSAEIEKIAKVDALFIRSRTDPMNVSFVASKMAEFYGIPVIDDPYSIQICSDKINMYYHLMNRNVSIPKTIFVKKNDIYKDYVNELFKELGSPIIFKEPSTSFSLRVEKVYNRDEFIKIAKRFIKLSDRIVAQEYIESQFDWRIGVLNGRFLYGCKYIIPSETFKIQATINGHVAYCAVKSAPKEKIPMDVINLAIKAANSIGKGLYGVDIKEANDTTYVIEVNDNPSLESGELDYYPNAYGEIISYLTGR